MYRVVLLLLALATVLVPAATAKPTFVIDRDVSIGGFPRDGTLQQAFSVFGRPTSSEGTYDTCRLTWRSYGVVMETYYTHGSLDPCGPAGRHKSTTVTDRRWRTSKGLDIGEPLSELRKLYPKARKDAPGKWRLTTRSFAGLPYPGLEAQIKSGRVVSLTVYGPRSGF